MGMLEVEGDTEAGAPLVEEAEVWELRQKGVLLKETEISMSKSSEKLIGKRRKVTKKRQTVQCKALRKM
jgi:hypothetical protein